VPRQGPHLPSSESLPTPQQLLEPLSVDIASKRSSSLLVYSSLASLVPEDGAQRSGQEARSPQTPHSTCRTNGLSEPMTGETERDSHR